MRIRAETYIENKTFVIGNESQSTTEMNVPREHQSRHHHSYNPHCIQDRERDHRNRHFFFFFLRLWNLSGTENLGFWQGKKGDLFWGFQFLDLFPARTDEGGGGRMIFRLSFNWDMTRQLYSTYDHSSLFGFFGPWPYWNRILFGLIEIWSNSYNYYNF